MATKTVRKPMTKTELIQYIADASNGEGLTKRNVKFVLETLTEVGHKQMKRVGQFTVPGFAKMVVVKKPATKAKKGLNPFTKEPMVFKAKPARKVVKARPVKAAKDAVL